MKKIFKIAYVSLFFVVLLGIGVMSFVKKDNSPKKEEQIELKVESYQKMFGNFDDYFSANFGFRNNLIQMNNTMKYKVFKQSGESNVIAGKEGWLFYERALHDYSGENILSDEDINKIAASIVAMAESCKAQGTEFVFVIAPNKMEIYGENMPYYLKADETPGNYEKLMEALSKEAVNVVDLKATLTKDNTFGDLKLYHKLDSHWNNLGAAVAYMNIMNKTSLSYTDYSLINYKSKKNFQGDLYEMLFPEGKELDTQYYFDKAEDFIYTSRFMGVDDLLITTENEEKKGSVLLFRDSFGNALYSFFANDFNTASISRALPYNVSDVKDKDLVVVEIVERNIPNLLEYIPIT